MIEVCTNNSICVGEIAWRLYKDKISIDLMSLMAEERSLLIDWEGFDLSKQRAQVHTHTHCYMESLHCLVISSQFLSAWPSYQREG